MSSDTMIRGEQTVAAPLETPADVLNRVVENVRRDCQTDTQLYLEESTVPHGGE